MDAALEKVLEFWFGPLDEAGLPAPGQNKLWFASDQDLDNTIRARFGGLHAQAVAGELDAWLAQPRTRLALIVLVDQFSRNLYRGRPEAFAWDHLALAWCKSGIRDGLDQHLALAERLFFYMPLQHVEDLEDQQLGVTSLQAMKPGLDDAALAQVNDTLRFQELHRDIVARFGRFPHRNAILGRTDTAEEAAYLADGAPSFGQ